VDMVEPSGGHVELQNAGPIKIVLYIKLSFKLYMKTYFN
jgi:hypothetical protein